MKKQIIFFLAAGAILGLGAWYVSRPAPVEKNLDAFASCLTSKKIAMYGAAWCPHCQNQKKLFGDSFRLVTYVECPDNIKLCTDKGVEGFPTWILQDGKKLVGEQSLEALSQASGCALPS